MSASRGQRKAALYLASLSARDRRQLMATLPAAAARPLSTLVDQLAARGWVDGEVMSELLAEELRGLTSDTALTVEDLLAISHELPSDLTARLFAANSAMDRRFMLALLEGPKARRVQDDLASCPMLPERLREALLAEAQVSARGLN